MVTMNLLTNGAPTSGHFPQDQLNLMQKRVSVSVRTTRRVTGALSMLIAGISSMVIAVFMSRYSLSDFALDQRAKMIPGIPPFTMWEKPEPEIRLSVFIFTVLNAQQFLDGTDAKLKLHEIGPIVYREWLTHEDITHHEENSTMSYTAVRTAEFLEHLNEPGILNRTITVPNFALLGAASMLHDASFLVKLGFKALRYSAADPVFLNITIDDYLWNYRSSLVRKASSLVPFMVPTENSGILHTIYKNFVDRYNVRIGTKYGGEEFFRINTVNDQTTVPGFSLARGDCDASIVNSTEGAVYGQRLTNKTVVWYWRRSLCRSVPLFFERELKVGQLDAYKFTLHNNTYDRFPNLTADCYKGMNKVMQDGLSDLSKCFFDLPFAASNPHFYGREAHFTDRIEGLNPERKYHASFIIMEPSMGVPIEQCAKSQNNIVVPNLSGFSSDLQRFNNMVLPLFWVQYHLPKLTDDITTMLVFVSIILPILQVVLTALFYFVAIILLLLCLLRYLQTQRLRLMDAVRNDPIEIIKSNAHHIVFEKDNGYCR